MKPCNRSSIKHCDRAALCRPALSLTLKGTIMRFDPLAWDEVSPNEENICKGTLRVRASREGALYVQVEGVEALYGLGTSFEVEAPSEMIWRLEAPAETRVFVQRMFGTSFQCEGESFTNIDRMPHESESVAEVTRARRMLELERRSFLAEVRAENAAISAQLAEKRKAAADEAERLEQVEAAHPEAGEEGNG